MFIIGSDEVGYGAWAGPLYVCAYAAPALWTLPGLNDSKKLSPKRRREIYAQLDFTHAVLLSVDAAKIDAMGPVRALVATHTQAIQELLGRGLPVERIVIDGNLRLPALPQVEAIPHADSSIPAVMAASIIAKCNRDHMMTQMHERHPEYGFASHVGYGTPEHMAALHAHGLCPLHRRSYKPMQPFREKAGA